MNENVKVILVEDEPDLATSVAYSLKREGFDVEVHHNAESALPLTTESNDFKVYVLDRMLPGMSGTELCQKIRSHPESAASGVIMATARGSEVDRITGLEAGADDYITKPYSVRELALRIQALLRRLGAPSQEEDHLTIGTLKIDVVAHRVWIEKNEVHLTMLEFRLLQTLVKRKGHALRRETLLRDVWGYHSHVTSRTVDTHVKRLREKLGPLAKHVQTIRGLGYRYMETVDD